MLTAALKSKLLDWCQENSTNNKHYFDNFYSSHATFRT